MMRIREVTDEMRHLQEQKKEALRDEAPRRGRRQDVSRGDGGDRRGT
jgi:hypothetical protein